MSICLKESDLYAPVRNFLAAQGFMVQGEVHSCDVVAVRNQHLVIVELKRGLTLALLAQAVDRQQMADEVYVAVPRPKRGLRQSPWKESAEVLRRLGVGLLFVSPETDVVDVAIEAVVRELRPSAKRRNGIIRELSGRSGDYNTGGSTRLKLLTAYRERALYIAACIQRYGPTSTARLRELGCDAKVRNILANNYYHWFERVTRGVYQLTEKGLKEIDLYETVVDKFRRQISDR